MADSKTHPSRILHTSPTEVVIQSLGARTQLLVLRQRADGELAVAGSLGVGLLADPVPRALSDIPLKRHAAADERLRSEYAIANEIARAFALRHEGEFWRGYGWLFRHRVDAERCAAEIAAYLDARYQPAEESPLDAPPPASMRLFDEKLAELGRLIDTLADFTKAPLPVVRIDTTKIDPAELEQMLRAPRQILQAPPGIEIPKDMLLSALRGNPAAILMVFDLLRLYAQEHYGFSKESPT